jgi:hypothetical protein
MVGEQQPTLVDKTSTLPDNIRSESADGVLAIKSKVSIPFDKTRITSTDNTHPLDGVGMHLDASPKVTAAAPLGAAAVESVASCCYRSKFCSKPQKHQGWCNTVFRPAMNSSANGTGNPSLTLPLHHTSAGSREEGGTAEDGVCSHGDDVSTEDETDSSGSEASSYIVEAILRERSGSGGVREYLVRWQGYDHNHNSWEPLQNLENCSVFLEFMAASNTGTNNAHQEHGKRKRKRKEPQPKTSNACAAFGGAGARVGAGAGAGADSTPTRSNRFKATQLFVSVPPPSFPPTTGTAEEQKTAARVRCSFLTRSSHCHGEHQRGQERRRSTALPTGCGEDAIGSHDCWA